MSLLDTTITIASSSLGFVTPFPSIFHQGPVVSRGVTRLKSPAAASTTGSICVSIAIFTQFPHSFTPKTCGALNKPLYVMGQDTFLRGEGVRLRETRETRYGVGEERSSCCMRTRSAHNAQYPFRALPVPRTTRSKVRAGFSGRTFRYLT